MFLQHMRMCHGWWKICLTAVIRMRTLCKHIFASAERNLIPLFLHSAIQFWSGSTLMQECFKNIKWRDVDKKIRLLEFYVFGNVTVYYSSMWYCWSSYSILVLLYCLVQNKLLQANKCILILFLIIIVTPSAHFISLEAKGSIYILKTATS